MLICTIILLFAIVHVCATCARPLRRRPLPSRMQRLQRAATETLFAIFFQHTDANADGGGQSLVSPGSCLEEFRPRPFIECHGIGRCNFFTTAYSYWLATIEDAQMFRKPRPQTLKENALKKRISRCAVCLRN